MNKSGFMIMWTILASLVLTAALAPASKAAVAADLSIYGDSLGAGWANWSWNSTVNFSATSPVHTGTRSTAVTYTAPWAGLYLHVDPAVDLSSYDRLTFWIHGGSSGNQQLRVVANGDGASTVSVTAQAGTWVKIEVLLSDLGSPSSLSDLYWQDIEGSSQPTFYLDDITLVAMTTPPPPGVGPHLSIDVGAGRHTISEDIYGMNFAEESLAAELKLPVRRWGGNSATRYNWQKDVHNTGSDWYFENIPDDNPDVASLPDGSVTDRFVDQDRRTETRTILTMPLIGWTPSRRLVDHPYDCSFKVSKYGLQQSTDPWDADCGNGLHTDGSPITGNSPGDTSEAIGPEFIIAWINHLTGKYGSAAAGGVAFYNLDNEPMLWNSTHRDVHPQPATYDELRDRTYQYSAAIKAADSTAQTLGPVLWGWCAYFYSALDGCGPGTDYRNHGNTPFVVWYLQQMKAYELQHGIRILDYLDLHYYPQANGVALSSAGNSATQALRLRATRSLWDPSYIDESWISDTASGGVAVQLIPRMKAWVASNYPGTRLAVTEYNWGALDHINGALAQADILGIFGREGLDLATLWGPPDATQPGAFAFRIYRNYDGAGKGFGDVGVQAQSADQGMLSVYAAERSADDALTVVVINKTAGALTSTVNLAGITPASTASVFRYSTAQPSAIERLPDLPVAAGGFSATFAANSITLLVITPATTTNKTLTATSTGTGSGTLSSANAGVTCSGSSCSGSLSSGTTAVINATAAVGSTFGNWTGCTSVSGTQCTVVMDANKTVTASFTLNQYTLRATASGTGTGSVTSSPSGIGFTYPAMSSGAATLSYGTSVVLTAAATGGGVAAWSGDCDAKGGSTAMATCTINNMNANKNVAVAFTAPATGITVTVPNGGEIWKVRSTKTISWTFTGNPGSYVKIELLKAGKLVSTITSRTKIGTANSGSYSWSIPARQATGTDYAIRVTSKTNGSYTDVSNSVFTISK